MSQKQKTKYHILMHIYMESKKIILMNLFADSNGDTDVDKRLVDTMGKGKGGKNGRE